MTKLRRLPWSQRVLLFLPAVLIVLVLVAGCGEDKDASIADRDTLPANVLNMPDGWSNIAMKCDGKGHRVYASDHGDSYSSAIAVIDDPSCGGGAP